ncbi:fibrous sheath-interacting protein 2 [Sceloporus undulatus]|uniref:fibrous sheath-interacting protein 2 n=1 Tax=Sceloporus undulatus TaxID=8520 RepID=UPI001C4B7A1E|nr:fibrous sheath-interacting protein 2 [Sceloporus undulatus]
MAYPSRGLLKAAMGHYLTESARTALEALEPEEDVVDLGPGKQMPTVGPNQILDMPLFTKIPFLPGSKTMFYTTNLGEKLYQPSATFDLNDPYCKIMAPKYKSLHDPHLRAYYKRKDNLRRLKKAGYITDKNKVVCTLKEFNEYRQYLTSLKLEFEKHYIKEQKMLEKQITKLQEPNVLPEGLDSTKYRDWLLKEERPTIQEQEAVMRNRYLELINQELEKLEQLAEENRRLSLAQDDKKQQGLEKRKQLLLRKKMEEEWRRKEMLLLMKIGDDVKREARIEEQRRKSKEEKLKKKQAMLEKKMAYHLKKIQEKFQKEGFLPPDQLFRVKAPEDHGLPAKKLASLAKKSMELRKKPPASEKKPSGPLGEKGGELPKAGGKGKGQGRGRRGSVLELQSQVSLPKAKGGTKESLTVLVPSASGEAPVPDTSAPSLEQGIDQSEKDPSKRESQDLEPAGGPLPSKTSGSKGSLTSAKEDVSMASSTVTNNLPAMEAGSSVAENATDKVLPSTSIGTISNEGAVSACGSTGCGSKTSCCGSAGCGSKTSCCNKSCCGSAGCGSNKSCCGSAGCGSNKSCCGSGGCGSKKSCCGSGGCGSKGSCCGSAGCGSKASCSGSGCGSGGCCSNGKCCGSGGCGSNNSKGTGDYDSSGSSKQGASGGPSKLPFTSSAGVAASHQSPMKPSTKTTMPSAIATHTVSEASGKGKQKKKATLMFSQSEPDSQPKERSSGKKRRGDKHKIEHLTSTSQDNDSESSYSAYLQCLLSNADQTALRESLKGKVSVSQLNGIIQNIMTWVVSAVTSILYPALTKFEERVRTRVYTISEESLLSSDNSSSCSTCNEDFYEAYGTLPSLSTRKVSFTDSSLKPATSTPSEFQATSGKPNSLLSSKSSFTSFTKSTHLSLDGDLFKGKFKRGKTAIFFSPAKHGGILSTRARMQSSKSDSHIFEMEKALSEAAEKPVALHHGKHGKSAALRGLFPKSDTTTATAGATTTTDTEGLPPTGGDHKPPRGPLAPRETLNLRDLKCIFAELKPPLSKITALVLNDVFKRILGDLGCTASTISLSMEVLLESISESILGSHPGGSPEAGSVSRIASFVASDLVENILSKLQATAQKKYVEMVSREEFSAECRAMYAVAAGKWTAPDPASWRARVPFSLESTHGMAEEILHFILDKLKVFALSSQTKVSQFELFAKIKAIGIPLDQFYAAIPPHTVESEAATSIVKDTIRKIVSKTVASSETNILQYVEEMISSILSYIQRQLSPEGSLPTRESSIILQIINDVFNNLSTENLRGIFPAAKPKMQGEAGSHEPPVVPDAKGTTVTTTTLFSAEKRMKTPLSPVNVPGMVIYSEAEVKGKEKKEPDGTLSSVNKECKVLVTEEAQDKVRYESFGLETRERSRSHPKPVVQGEEGFLDKDRKVEPSHLDKTERTLDNFVQEAIFCSVEGHQTVTRPADPKSGDWTLEKALKKLEEDFKEEERSPIIPIVRKLLNEMFQHVWVEQPIWPPKTPPCSLAHLGLSRQPLEGQPAFKGPQAPVSEADVSAFASDLVKTAFQTISRATQTDPQDAISRHPNLVITDILPLKIPGEAGKALPTVHFKDPETGAEPGGQPQGEAEAPAKDATEEATKEQTLSSRPDLVSDLVQTFMTKLECFVTSKVESQLCLDVQNLKTSMSSDFSSTIHQELRRILASPQGCFPSCLEDILNACGSSTLTEKEKGEHGLPLSYSQLKSYAQEVARMLLKTLKQGLDREVEKIPTPPVVFSESIAASQIVTMVFTVIAPREYECEEGFPRGLPCKESVLEKLLRKNATYKRELQIQIQNTVETFLNEIYQTIMLEVGGPSSARPEGSQVSKETDDSTSAVLSKPTVVKSDVSVVSSDLVDIVLKDLSSGLAAALHKKGPLSTRLQSLLFELIQRTVEPFTPKAGHKSRFPDFESGRCQVSGRLKGDSRIKMGEDGTNQIPELKDFSPEGITKYLVDNIVLRLEKFAQEKVEMELALAIQQQETHANYGQRAKLAVQDSQSNLRLCAEKLTCTILKVIQKDLEREMLSCQNIIPYEENASANEVMNDLLKILSVQIALTENEVHKRVLQRIFRRQPAGQRGRFPLMARVEDVLNQVTQRIMGDLGHLPSFNNESIFIGSETRSSRYHALAEASSQGNTGHVAGEIVDGVLSKMYSVVVDTLFSSSESKSDPGSSSSDRGLLFTDLMGKSDLQKMTLAVSQLHPAPQSLGEELVQTVLNKIACFAASNLEEFLPLQTQPRRRMHMSLQYDLQGGDAAAMCRPKVFSDDSETSLMKVNLSKSDLTIYAKEVVSKVLGNIIDEFKMEDYHRTILRVNTLSSEQISIASDLVHSIVQDLHITKHSKADGLSSTQVYFQFESSLKGKPKSLFYEDFSSFLKQVLPKEGILREIFEQQPLTDANINESLKMLQVAENIVSEVFMRTRDLESSVSILKRTPGELGEKLFCYSFKRGEGPGLFHSDSQAEIGSVARDIVASVFENVHKCLICSIPARPERECFPPRKEQDRAKGSVKIKHRFTQPEFPFYNVSLKGAMDMIDKIAKDAVECVVLMLETFVIRHFRRDFKCNFLEIVKFPLESLSFAQLTRSLDSLSNHVGNVAETTMEAFRGKLQGGSGREALPTLGSSPNFMDFSKLGGAITRECIETAIRQVQMLHSELSVYANNAVSGILEIIKHTLDRELTHKEATLFSSSSDSLVLSETISAMLDRCNESLTEITSELMVENLQLEMSGRTFAKEKSLIQDLVASPAVKTTSKKYRRVDLRDSFPPINVPGMVIYSEEEAEVQEETPSKFPSVWDAHAAPERGRGVPLSSSTPRSRPPARRRQERSLSKYRVDFLEDDWLPRERSIPEGSILEKLFKKTAESEVGHRLTKTEPQSKAASLSQAEPIGRGLPFHVPEGICYSAICPLKLGQTAEMIVDTLLCEFGLDNGAMTVQSNVCERFCSRSPTKEKGPHGNSASSAAMLVDIKKHRSSLLSRWEKKMSDSSERTTMDESSLLSKWESKHCIFRPKSPERLKEMELLACSHVPDPCEIHLLANHIVLSVIKELIFFQPKDVLDEKVPAWKQELLQSESKWLQERIWRSTYLPSVRRQSSCLEMFWEPLTLAVVSNVLVSISHPNTRHSPRARSRLFDSSLSMFCSVDAGCPEHELKGSSRSFPLNIEELAFHISEVIVSLLCERHVLHEGVKKKGCRAKRTRYIYVPPLCLADFDNVYHPLVKEVSNLLSLEIQVRGKMAGEGRPGDFSQLQQPFTSPRCFSRASRGDCRSPGDLKGAACLSVLGQMVHKNQRLSSVATNLDNFIRSLKSTEAKHLVNKVLHIILDSLWPEQSPGGFPDAQYQNMMSYQEAGLPTKGPLSCSSMCPHAYKLSDGVTSGNLGLSPKSVVLLDIVSEKLIRTLLDKCLMTEHFTGTFAFDEFPEDEQIGNIQKCVSDEDLLQYSRREMQSYDADASSSVFTYDIKYTEEPGVGVESGVSSYDSALDLLAHTLVKPVMTELSLSIESPGHFRPSSRKSVGFSQTGSRKPRGQTFGRKHTRHSRSEGYSSLPRGRKPEQSGSLQARRQSRRSSQERNKTVLETAIQHRAFMSRPPAHTSGRPTARTTCTKKTYRREVVTMSGRGDHRQRSPAFSSLYSPLFLEEVVSQFLIKIFSSLQSRYDRETCMSLKEMNVLFVNTLVEEFRKAGVGVVRRAEEKTYFPQVDSHLVDRITDSILREFGFQLAADTDFGSSVEMMAELAAEIILTEILDYQLPPLVCRKLPSAACKNIKPERILQRIEHCICFPKSSKKRPPPPTYITVLSQKYLERVVNRLLAQLFPEPQGTPQKQERRQLPGEDFDELCSYMINEVMKSISKHKIWVAKKDDRCRLQSEKEIQSMVDSVYKNMLKKSGTQLSIQKEVKSRDAAFVDKITSFIIQEITKHHLQTFLSKDQLASVGPDPEALSENIVSTVLDSINEPSTSQAEVFPAKFLEEIVSKVLSKVLGAFGERKDTAKGQQEVDLAQVAKRLASSINLRFGRAALTEGPRGADQSLGGPLTDIMDDVVDSVCNKISREIEGIPGGDLIYAGEGALLENVKRLVEKCIADYLLHPLFSGDVFKPSPPSYESATKIARELAEENESSSPFSTFLSSGFLKDLITGLLSKIFPSAPCRDTASPWEKRLPSEADLNKLSTQLLDDVRMKLLKHEIRVTRDAPPGQYEYSEEDVQNMTDSLCQKIIQRSGSLEAVQKEVRNKSNALIDWIAGFLVGDILQQHVQPFVGRDEAPPWDRAAAGDSTGGLEIYRTSIKPHNLTEAGGASASSLLGDIISELLSKLSSTLMDIPLSASGNDSGDTAVRLAQSLTKELMKAGLSVREGPEEQLGSAPPPHPLEDKSLADWRLPGKGPIQGWPSKEHTDEGQDASLQQTATVIIEEAVDHLLQSTCPSNMTEARCLIQDKMVEELDGPETRPPAAYTTVLSYSVIEAIVEKVLSRIFPAPSGTVPCPSPEDRPLGSDWQDRVAEIKRAIMEMVLKQAIWTSMYGDKKETGIAEEAVGEMVESVYCDVLHEVLLRQPFPEDRETLSNLYITQIACFILNEMFKYHLQSLGPEGPLSYGDSCLTVFPCQLLEDILNQLLDKIFPNPETVATYIGKQTDFSESDFIEMAMNMKSYVVTEILAHEIKLENLPERVPDMDHETEEDIASSVYNQVLQKYPSLGDLQNALAQPGNGSICQVANSLMREILNFHLHPFLSDSNSSNNECTKWQTERQLYSRRIYPALFLEDIVVAFFCKILSSPHFLTYSKDSGLSECRMRDLIIQLVNALVAEFKISEVKVIQSMEEDSSFPQIAPEIVVEISNSIYEKLQQQFGSELEIFNAFQNNIHMLAGKLAPLMIREISGYQLLPLFTGDTSPYLFSFLEAETIMDRVETILPETTSSRSVFGEMFVKILRRIFPSWMSGDSVEAPDGTSLGDMTKRSLPTMPAKEEAGPDANRSIQSLMENIYKTVCVKSGSPNRKYEDTTEECAGFLPKKRQDDQPPRSHSPPGRSHPSSTIIAETAAWTIHHVKLGEGQSQPMPVKDGGDIYSSSFLKDVFSGLVSKLLSSATDVCTPEKTEPEAEPPVENLVESILTEFAKSPVKVLQIPKEGQTPPDVGKTEVAKIIHGSLCDILQDQGLGVPFGTDKESLNNLAERLACAIKKEILGYQIQQGPAKTTQEPTSKPFESGEMAKTVLMEVKKIRMPSPTSKPHPLLVSQKFIHDVLAFLLSKILPLPTDASTSSDTEDQCAEFDFIHMKLLSKVMAELDQDENTEVQYLDQVQPNRVVSQTVANSVYNDLLPEFGTPSTIEKCIKAGCTILLGRISDIVIKEISGNKMQTYFSEEQSRQEEAVEAEREMERRYGPGPEPPEGVAPLRSHLKGLSSIILEEVAAKFLSKMFHSLSLDEVEESSLAAVKEVAKKIISSLQGLISKNKLQVWQNDEEEDLDSEDSRAVGEVVDSVYTDIMKNSSSETSLYEDLTSKNEDLINRVACFMVSEISKRDFQSGSESEEDFPRSDPDIKLQSDKIIQKFLNDVEIEKAKKETAEAPTPVVSVAFLEEILSRFLTTILLEQYDLGIHEKNSLSKTDVNEIASLLKTSVEKEMSKNKIGLVASGENQLELDPQYEDVVNQVVHAVISNVMEKSGSQQELYNDMTTNQVIFPEQVASIIINEISSCNMGNPPGEYAESETCSALELDRIVSKVIAQVSSHMDPDEEESFLMLHTLPELPEEATPEVLHQSSELPKIIPYIGHRPLKIDPDIISDHLAVLSIKTEPLEKLKKTCLSRIGISLTELRRASASGKSITHDLGIHEVAEVHQRKERRPSLDMAGRLGVRPKEAVCRNSFQSLMKPDITKVELLKDVESKQDLIVRLVAHDIDEDEIHRSWAEESDSDEEEQVLTEQRSFFFEVPPFTVRPNTKPSASSSEPLLTKTSSSSSQRKGLIESGDSLGPAKERKEFFGSSAVMYEPMAGPIPEATEEASTPSSFSVSPGSDTKVMETLAVPSQEKSLEKVVVGMHLSRDTEETGASFEITSVYQDKNIKEPVSEEHSEVEDGKVIAVTSSEVAMPPRRSSVFDKVSSALSKVFSRTSTSVAQSSSVSSQEKAAKE